jgi:hypothetical protein
MEIKIREEIDYGNPENDCRVLVIIPKTEEVWHQLITLVSTDTHPVDNVVINRDDREVTFTIGTRKVVGE